VLLTGSSLTFLDIGNLIDLQKCFGLEGNMMPIAFSLGHRAQSKIRAFHDPKNVFMLLQPWAKESDPIQIARLFSDDERKALEPRIQNWIDSSHWRHTRTYSGIMLSPLLFDLFLHEESVSKFRRSPNNCASFVSCFL